MKANLNKKETALMALIASRATGVLRKVKLDSGEVVFSLSREEDRELNALADKLALSVTDTLRHFMPRKPRRKVEA